MKKRTVVKQKPRVDVTMVMFAKLIAYLFSDYKTRAFVKKLDIFFNTVDNTIFKEDVDLAPRYWLVKEFIKAYHIDQINDLDLIGMRLQDHLEVKDSFEEILDEVTSYTLSIGDATAIENMFIERLNYAAAIPILERLKANIAKLDNGEFSSFGEVMEGLQKSAIEFNKIMVSKSRHNFSIPDISFASDEFETQMEKIHKSLTDEKRIIKTGIRRLNDFLGKGFQPGRVYIFLGITGGWKSSLLLNIIFWAAKYNLETSCKDISKKPLFLYISQENDLEETIERSMSYVGATDENQNPYKNFDIVMKKMRNEFDTTRCDIKLMYRPKGSINTADLDTIINDIEAEGEYEVKLLVHDYLKRIDPAVSKNDLRIDLGEAVNDLSILSKMRKIPVISANQMNREAYKLLEQELTDINKKDTKTIDKKDLGRSINLSMQSESNQISENADAIFAIHREYLKATDQWFLTFKDLKNRSSKKGRDMKNVYFAHPFEEGNGMRLVEDINLPKSMSINNISDLLEGFDINDNGGIEEENISANAELDSAFSDD